MPIKMTTTTETGKRKKKKKKNFRRVYRTSKKKKKRRINVFLESLLLEPFPSLGVTVHPNTVLISGPAVGAAHILIWSYPCVSLPPVSTAIRTSVFSFVGALNDL